MNDKIIHQVCGVLEKYNKRYTTRGVMANLNAWERSKRPLIDLLRKHPNWHEDALAVVFEVTQSREIDRYTVYPLKNAVAELVEGMDLSCDDRANFNYSLDTAIGPYNKLLPSDDVVSSIKHYSGVSCAVGQKTSRAINRICQRYGLDRHSEYNARFAQLADSLNPMQVRRKAVLSVHPCDYLEMSNEDNSWSSCHCIRQGEYHAGTLSYMNDPVSLIFYTVGEHVTGSYHTEPKITRQVFSYGDGILLQSRLYPHTDDEEARSIYRDIVQRTISLCLEEPNLWTLYRTQEHVDRYCHTHCDALHYTDYIYKYYRPNVSLLKSYPDSDFKAITIGSTAYCLDCACKLHRNDSLHCSDCGGSDYTACADCGEQIELDSDEDYYIDGNHYCPDCVFWCERCQEHTRSETTEVHDQNGYHINVCSYCCDEHYSYCEDCGEYFPNDAGEELEDDYFHCQRCLDKYYFTCDSCLEYVRFEDGSEIDGKLYCAGCAAEVRGAMEENAAKQLITA